MKQLLLNPTIYKYDFCKKFCKEFRIGKDDLIITNKKIYDNYLKYNVNEAAVIFKENYGGGEPSDEMIEAMYENIKRISYERVIAIGGGSILDIGKLFALKNISPVTDLCSHKLEIVKEKELVLVPTTCGTGSEVTNVSILELKSKNIKINLVTDELCCDSAVMIPELLECLPFDIFATSSINAFIQAIDSFLSTKATPYTKIFSLSAIELILKGLKKIVGEKEVVKRKILNDFLLASSYSGIALGNVGGGVIQTMSYSLSKKYNIPYREANYVMFIDILKMYKKLNNDEQIKELNKYLASLLECVEDKIFEKIDELLCSLITKKPLRRYVVNENDIKELAYIAIKEQENLKMGNYISLNEILIRDLYKLI